MHNVGIESGPSVTEQAISGPQDLTAAHFAITAGAFSQYWTDWLHRSVGYEKYGPDGRVLVLVLVKDEQQNIE